MAVTLFGEKLQKILAENQISVSQTVQKAGIERTMVSKIKKGERLPDGEYINKLIDALSITPFEKDELLSAYNISRDGEFLYNQRIQVRRLIDRMSAAQTLTASGGTPPLYNLGAAEDERAVSVVSGALPVNNLIDDILTRELRAANPGVKFFMPSDYAFFYDNLFLKHLKNPALKVECLFEFAKSAVNISEKRNANLDVIDALAPFVMHGGAFAAHYVYSDRSTVQAFMSAMPYFIITSGVTVTLTADLQTAVALNSADATACYRGIFDGMKAKGRPLIGCVASFEETVAFYSANANNETGGIAGFGSHPCIAVYYDRPMYNAHVPADVPNREQMIDISCVICDGIRDLRDKGVSPSVFTMEGLRTFVEHGVIQTMVEQFFSPYEPWERADILQRMISDIEADVMVSRIADTSKMKIPACFYADVFRGSHMNLVIGNGAGEINTINIFEKSVVEAFFDFLVNAVETDIVYSKADTLNTLRMALERVKTLC